MGICCELIKTDYSTPYVEGVKGLAAQHMYFMLLKKRKNPECAQINIF
jgi:hypothetical protein